MTADSPRDRNNPALPVDDGHAEDRYPERIADAALRRAAQLQAEAAERIERQARGRASDDRLSRTELLAIAEESGIGAEYMSLALAEVEREGEGALTLIDAEADAGITRWLGSARRSVSVARAIQAPAAEILAVLPDVFEGDEFRLVYDGHGDLHPLAGGVLRFRMPRLMDMATTIGSYTQLCHRLEQLEMWNLQVTLHDHGERTEIVIYGDLRRGAVTNVKAAKGFTFGFGLAVLGATAAACVSGGLGLLAIAPALAAGASSGGATMLAYRGAYRSALAKALVELERLLIAVERRVQRARLLPGPRP